MEAGTLTPVSALFPSTTAASVSTMNLGVLPAQHALYEWNIYIPAYGEVIQSLAFTPLGRHPPDACRAKGYDPGKLLEVHETVHQRLGRRGARSIQFAHRSYAGSAYNTVASAGAKIVRHSTQAEGLVQMKEALLATTGKAVLSFYWAAIDSIAHVHGPGPSYHAAEIASFWRTFDEIFADVESPGTLYLFTADHGHVYADARATIYINERIPALADCLPLSPTGNPIYPNGSPRDMFLHVRPERVAEVLGLLHRELDDVALILPMEQVLAEGLFGPGPISPELRRRLGRYPDPALPGHLHLVARARPHAERLLRPPRRPLAPGADHRRRHHRRAVAADDAGVPCRGSPPLHVAVGDDRGHEPISAVGAIPWITLQEADEFVVLRGLLAYEAARTRLSEIVVGEIVPPMVMDTEKPCIRLVSGPHIILVHIPEHSNVLDLAQRFVISGISPSLTSLGMLSGRHGQPRLAQSPASTTRVATFQEME